MKRELKGYEDLTREEARKRHRKAHPDEKGTERIPQPSTSRTSMKIARPIPMKRELKAGKGTIGAAILEINRKAHPDEKGTERGGGNTERSCSLLNRKAHPDEKGTERRVLRPGGYLLAFGSQGPSR